MKLLYKSLHSVSDGQYLMFADANNLKSVYIFEVTGDEYTVLKSAHMRSKSTNYNDCPRELKVEEADKTTKITRDAISNNDFPVFELTDDEYLITISDLI